MANSLASAGTLWQPAQDPALRAAAVRLIELRRPRYMERIGIEGVVREILEAPLGTSPWVIALETIWSQERGSDPLGLGEECLATLASRAAACLWDLTTNYRYSERYGMWDMRNLHADARHRRLAYFDLMLFAQIVDPIIARGDLPAMLRIVFDLVLGNDWERRFLRVQCQMQAAALKALVEQEKGKAAESAR